MLYINHDWKSDKNSDFTLYVFFVSVLIISQQLGVEVGRHAKLQFAGFEFVLDVGEQIYVGGRQQLLMMVLGIDLYGTKNRSC